MNRYLLELLGLGAGQALSYWQQQNQPPPEHIHQEPQGQAQWGAPQPMNPNNQMDWVELAEFIEMERAAQDCGCEVDCACI